MSHAFVLNVMDKSGPDILFAPFLFAPLSFLGYLLFEWSGSQELDSKFRISSGNISCP